MIMDELRVTGDEVVEVKGMIGMADLKELVLDARPDLLWPSFTPRVPGTGAGPRRRHVRRDPPEGHAAAPPLRDLRHGGAVPEQAARDPDVVAIKQTLYRTSATARSSAHCARRPRRASR
jgi:polyphosphate kinase